MIGTDDADEDNQYAHTRHRIDMSWAPICDRQDNRTGTGLVCLVAVQPVDDDKKLD